MFRFVPWVMVLALSAFAQSRQSVSDRLATTIFGNGAIPGFRECEYAFSAAKDAPLRTAGIADESNGRYGVAMRDFDGWAVVVISGDTDMTDCYDSAYELTVNFCRAGGVATCFEQSPIEIEISSPMLTSESFANMVRTDDFNRKNPNTKVTFGHFSCEEDSMTTEAILRAIELDLHRELSKNASVAEENRAQHWNLFKCAQYALGEVIAEQ